MESKITFNTNENSLTISIQNKNDASQISQIHVPFPFMDQPDLCDLNSFFKARREEKTKFFKAKVAMAIEYKSHHGVRKQTNKQIND